MASSDSVTTCLSSAVHYVICELGFEKKEIYDIDNIVSEDGEVHWQAITEHVHYLEPDQSVDYIRSIRSLGPVCESVNLHFKSLTKEKFVVQYALWFHWTNCTEVHLLIGKDCPFLLRDLLASEELAVVFGRVIVRREKKLFLCYFFRYADCVILLLPQLEVGLRLLFTTANKCPNRLLTAESSVFYTTFDEMLTKHLDNEEVNQLPSVLEEPAMASVLKILFVAEFLWDFLNHQEGPRIRDHLSHGEINLKAFPREIANQLVAFAITLLCRFSGEGMVSFKDSLKELVFFLNSFCNQEHLVIKPLMNCASCYHSRFHPISRLKKQVLECMKSIRSWHELPTVSEEHIQTIKGLEGSTEASTLVLMMTEILTQLQQYLPCNCYSSGDPMSTVATERLLLRLCDSHICTLYSPRPVLEVLVVLRKISTQCHQVSEQVIASIKSRYQQWTEKTLRSRQRHNYLRMLNSIKFLSPVLRLILVFITLELVNVHLVCKKNPSDYHQYVKFLKSVLQYTENLVTYTSPEKNKWDETVQLTNKALIKIRKFIDGKLTLIQSVK
ncbi:UNVERIFIED_CONTAM: hypothetical protein H355_013311 [Colinus virginianus]|nr:hypothetical protein H355_013311 [Colinus virginianus]